MDLFLQQILAYILAIFCYEINCLASRSCKNSACTMQGRDIRTMRRMGLKLQAMRRRNGPAGRERAATARLRKMRAAQRGFVRTAGFFGRFAGGAELKFHDLDIDDAVIAAGVTVAANSCNLIAQGTTESQRVGRKCVIRSINWRLTLTKAEGDGVTDPPNADTVRILLYLDKQCNGAAATATDILESANYQSFNNLANKSRFRTLMDRTYDLNHQAGGGNGTNSDWAQVQISDTFFKRVNIPIEFDGVNGTLTEIRSNNIGCLTMSGSGVTLLDSKMRLRFSDA